jgi:hypothetical protein
MNNCSAVDDLLLQCTKRVYKRFDKPMWKFFVLNKKPCAATTLATMEYLGPREEGLGMAEHSEC